MKLIVTSRKTSEATCHDSAIMRDDLVTTQYYISLDGAQKEYLVIKSFIINELSQSMACLSGTTHGESGQFVD